MLDLSVHCKVGSTLWEFWDWNGGTSEVSILDAPGASAWGFGMASVRTTVS